MTPEFWKGKKVLVTGHTGFKGSWLSLWLQSLGAEVCGFALEPPTQPNLFETAAVERGMTSVLGDVRNLPAVAAAFEQFEPDIVIHTAAQPLVQQSYLDPVATYTTNVLGTINILEAVRKAKTVRVVINVTSDKCYENKEWLWGYRENDALGGHDPYSNSKACSELVTSAYRNSYFCARKDGVPGVALASARAGNVIGGGDWAPNRLVPDALKAMMAGRPVVIRNPHAIRPWQHVLEPLHGYLMLAERLWGNGPEFSEAWNFGPRDEDARPVSWVVTQLTGLWGNGSRWVLDGRHHPHEAGYLKLDSSKSTTRLEWKPKLALSQALEWVIEWHRAFCHKQEMRPLTEHQIKCYQALKPHGMEEMPSPMAGAA
jgi:CDP-glucose 4,6-dehydratase